MGGKGTPRSLVNQRRRGNVDPPGSLQMLRAIDKEEGVPAKGKMNDPIRRAAPRAQEHRFEGEEGIPPASPVDSLRPCLEDLARGVNQPQGGPVSLAITVDPEAECFGLAWDDGEMVVSGHYSGKLPSRLEAIGDSERSDSQPELG